FFSDVYSLGLLVMPDVVGIRNTGRCSFATNISRSDDRFRCATIDLHMWHAVGLVQPRNLRRPKHNGNSQAISLLAFSGHSYGWLDMSPDWAISRYLDNAIHQRRDSAAS